MGFGDVAGTNVIRNALAARNNEAWELGNVLPITRSEALTNVL